MNEKNHNTQRTTKTEGIGETSDAYRAQIREPQVRNADNEWLGAVGGPSFLVGYLDEVNGPGAAEVAGFVPTRHELLELARYWTNVAVEIEYDWFLFDQVGSSDIRRQPFAWRRVGRIQELLGDEVCNVVDQVYEEYGKKQKPRYWEAFRHGSTEQQKAVKDELNGLLNRDEHDDEE
jgi:hypothetical protein